MQIVCRDFPSGKSKLPIYMCALSSGRLVTEIPAVDLNLVSILAGNSGKD